MPKDNKKKQTKRIPEEKNYLHRMNRLMKGGYKVKLQEIQ